MSPAGYWPQLRAAVEAGADAVYFGLNHFSARAKVGFTLDELPRVMRTLHERAVKGFVTFNTLVFDHEVELAKQAILAIDQAGVDAIIVQDIGIVKLAKEVAPNLEIHGSTQMSITSAEGAEFAKDLGCSRVVLGRELSLANIRQIAQATDVELEVFIHGALCVSYSGQCFSSEAWGGRSANRGKCAQACRLSYDLIVDDDKRDLGAYRYLLSPGDLYTLEQIPELVDIGVACVKIEGRYKDADYVALTTRAYREAIDLAVAAVPNEISDDERAELEQVYSRGLGPHFMSGVNHQNVVIGRAPRHRGLRLGTITSIEDNAVVVHSTREVRPGDGVVFDSADWRSPDEPEEGGNVYEVKPLPNKSDSEGTSVRLKFGRGEIDFSRIRIGDVLWRTNDPQLKKQLKQLTTSKKPVFTRGLKFEVVANVGEKLKITAKADTGETASFESLHPVDAAQKRALDPETLTEKLGRLGGTPFSLSEIQLTSTSPAFVPTSLLNSARRKLVEQLLAQRVSNPKVASTPLVPSEYKAPEPAPKDPNDPVELHLLVRTAEQLDAAIACQPSSITLDYLELYGLRPSVEKIKSNNILARVASPRILKPSEQKIVKFLLSLECPILVRSAGLLQGLKESEAELPVLIGDFSLNVANYLTAKSFLDSGIAKVTPTYDLNATQIKELAMQLPTPALEVIAYSHLPVFHTEHCVFCRFLSKGTDNTNCGHPCEKHKVAVRDSEGREHPVMADVGCRNTVFGAQAQTDVTALAGWFDNGVRHYRLEFVHESPREVTEISKAFQTAIEAGLSDQKATEELHRELEHHAPQNITQGSLFVPKDFKNLVELT